MSNVGVSRGEGENDKNVLGVRRHKIMANLVRQFEKIGLLLKAIGSH